MNMNWLAKVKAPHVVIAGCASDRSGVKRWTTRWPRAQIHVFEVVPSCLALVRRTWGKTPKVHINALALSDTCEPITFYENNIPMLSSRLPFNRDSRRFVTGWGGETAREVEATTLDAYCAERGIQRIGFIELDVQGGELAVLKGAAGLLECKGIDALMIEVFYQELYEGVPLEPAVSNYLAGFGYRQAAANRRKGAVWGDITYTVR